MIRDRHRQQYGGTCAECASAGGLELWLASYDNGQRWSFGGTTITQSTSENCERQNRCA
jgi:hypothetical protein